jgi:uncharacterized protein (DUF1800 family)
MNIARSQSIAISYRTRAAQVAATAVVLSLVIFGTAGCNAVVNSAGQVATPSSITIQPAQVSVQTGGVDQLTAMQQGTVVTSGQWQIPGTASYGSIDASGLYHAPSTLPSSSAVLINYVVGTQTYSIIIIVVVPTAPVAPVVATIVQATQATVQVQGTDHFVATQQGIAVPGGEWVVLGGSSNGSIDDQGNYTAPSSVPAPSTISIGFILGNDITFASVTIVNAAPVIASVSPVQINQLVTPIVLTGTGFSAGSVLSVGSSPVATTFIDSSHLSAVVSLNDPVNTTVELTVSTPGNGLSESIPFPLPAVFPSISIQPSTLVGGPITLSIAGSGFGAGDIVRLNGNPMVTTVNSSSSITATGFLNPWITGSVIAEVSADDGTQPLAGKSMPIQATPVSYDAASRFSTQAALGTRPDVVQSIQNLGFDAWITQQFQQSPIAFSPAYNARSMLIHNAITGSSLLRQRLALALQSFIVPSGADFGPSSYNFEETLERDSSGNFRQLLSDVASDPNIGSFLNLMGNRAATDSIVQPNQNFAREVMQLFSIGPVMLNDDGSVQLDSSGSPIPSYTQDTVINLTRALTGWFAPIEVNQADVGWGVDYSQPLSNAEWAHDLNAKLLFGAVILPPGQTTFQDRTMALDAIFNHPNVPPFISHLMIQRLVTSNPSPAYIQRISRVFEDNGSGVRGDLTAVVRAILLDPEARLGDTTPSANDGFLQEPFLWQVSTMSILNDSGSDDQIYNIASGIGEPLWYAPTVFGFFSPSYNIPGTSIVSPEFGLLNNISVIQKTDLLWDIITRQIGGFTNFYAPSSWLFQNFTTVPTMLDALNHLVYHGQMSQQEQSVINAYCSQLNPFDTQFQLQSAVFLALNADSYNVSH